MPRPHPLSLAGGTLSLELPPKSLAVCELD
jgi:hypothetical protein